jgi:hypothetical protein
MFSCYVIFKIDVSEAYNQHGKLKVALLQIVL